MLAALVSRKRQPWPKCPRSHFPLVLREKESTADEFDAMWKIVSMLSIDNPKLSLTLCQLDKPVLHFYYQKVSKSRFHLEEMQDNQGLHQWLLAHCDKLSNCLWISPLKIWSMDS
ncbi:hypothetical protein TNCV_605351 [Trichonephila clavipes]|nr:hypothetical protein TNCV_605351 [Trichonephila clavipes]